MSMARRAGPDNLTIQHVQRCEQGGGAVALAIVGQYRHALSSWAIPVECVCHQAQGIVKQTAVVSLHGRYELGGSPHSSPPLPPRSGPLVADQCVDNTAPLGRWRAHR